MGGLKLSSLRPQVNKSEVIFNYLKDLKQSSLSILPRLKEIQYLNRFYPKLLTLIGIIGGLLKSLLVVGHICTKPISKLSMRSDLVNQLFTFEIKSKQKTRNIYEIQDPGKDGNNEEKNKKLIPRSKSMTLGKEYEQQQNLEKNENQQLNSNLKTADQLVQNEQYKFSPVNFDSYQNFQRRSIQEFNQNQDPFVFGHLQNDQQKDYQRIFQKQSGQDRSPQIYFQNNDYQQIFRSQFEDQSKQASEKQNDYSSTEDQSNMNQNMSPNSKRLNSSKFAGKISKLIGNKKDSIILSGSDVGQIDQDAYSQKDQLSCINFDRKQLKHNSLINLELENGLGLHTTGTTGSPFQTSPEDKMHQYIFNTEPENCTQNMSIDTKSTYKKGPTINEGKIKTFKHSHSQSEDVKTTKLEIQKELEDTILKQRRNGNFDRDNKKFVKKDPNLQVPSSNNIILDNDAQLIENEQKQNGEIQKTINKKSSIKKQLSKKVTIKDQNQRAGSLITNQDQLPLKQSSSKRIKSFFSTKTKEITGLIRFHIQQMQKSKPKKSDDQNNLNSQEDQLNNNDQKDQQKQNLERQKTHKQFDGIINQKQEKSIVLSLVDYVKYFFGCFKDTPKVKQMKYTNKKVKNRLDIIYILEKLIEIDKLKVLLLNPDQINLFDYMPKEFVQSDIQEGENFDMFNKHNKFATWSLLCAERSSLDKISNACIAYHHIQQNQNKTKIDSKLIQMLDPQVKRYFNKTLIQPNDVKHYRRLQAHYSMDEIELSKQIENQKDDNLKQQDNLLYMQNTVSTPYLLNYQNNFSRQSCFERSNQNTQWGLDSNYQQQIHNSLMNNVFSPARSTTETQSFQHLDKISNLNNFCLPERLNDKKLSLLSSQNIYTNSPKIDSKNQPQNSQTDIDTLTMNILKSKRSNYISQKSKIKTMNYCCPIIEESNMISSEKFGKSPSPRSTQDNIFSGNIFNEKKPSILHSRVQSIAIKNDEINQYMQSLNSQEPSQFDTKIDMPNIENGLKREKQQGDAILFQESEQHSINQLDQTSKSQTPKKNPQFVNEMYNSSNSKQTYNTQTQEDDLDENLKINHQILNSIFNSSNSKQNQYTQEEDITINFRKIV